MYISILFCSIIYVINVTIIEIDQKNYCVVCAEIVKQENSNGQYRARVIVQNGDEVISTTTEVLEGYRIVEYVSVVSGQVVLGVDAWRDLTGSIRSFVGGRAKGLENELRDGFLMADADIREEAYLLGANAVIGVRFNGGIEVAGESSVNDKMAIITATGTAVIVKKIED